MTPQIFAIYFYWHYGQGLKDLLRIWKNFLLFGNNFFSVVILLNSLFAPWKRIATSYGRGFDPAVWARAFAENMIMRGLGAVIRSIVISIGLIAELIIFVAGFSLVIIWILMPVAVPMAILTALSLIFL